MSAVRNRILGVAFAGVVATTVVLAPSAMATSLPPVTISLTNGSGSTVFNAADYGQAWGNPDNTFSFVGDTSQAGQWNLGWSLLVRTNPFVIANFVVTNNSLMTETFTLSVTSPVGGPGFTEVTMGGSVTGTLTDLNGNGATLSSPIDGSLYTAFIDMAPVATLLDDPFTVSSGAWESAVVGPASFGDPIPSMPGPDALNTIGITLTFTLSPGDAASFTSIFVINGVKIPAPAGVAILALAGLAGRGRRRRA